MNLPTLEAWRWPSPPSLLGRIILNYTTQYTSYFPFLSILRRIILKYISYFPFLCPVENHIEKDFIFSLSVSLSFQILSWSIENRNFWSESYSLFPLLLNLTMKNGVNENIKRNWRKSNIWPLYVWHRWYPIKSVLVWVKISQCLSFCLGKLRLPYLKW